MYFIRNAQAAGAKLKPTSNSRLEVTEVDGVVWVISMFFYFSVKDPGMDLAENFVDERQGS
jgi:hypothetical protein